MISYPSGLFHFLMAEIDWLQQIKNRNYDEDIVLRMPSNLLGKEYFWQHSETLLILSTALWALHIQNMEEKFQIVWEIYV